MNNDERRSKYYYEDSDILMNKIDVKDVSLLDEYERRVVALKLLIINHTNFHEEFDKIRLKEIHKFLFSEIYDFAGEFREENIAKDDFRFASCEFIEDELDRVLCVLEDKEENMKLKKDDFAKLLANVMAELNVIHPFREGNGRTYREFIREYAEECSYSLDWSKVSYQELFDSSLESINDIESLTQVIKKCLTKKRK